MGALVKGPWLSTTGLPTRAFSLRLAVAEGREPGVRRPGVVAEATVFPRVDRSPVDAAVVAVVMREGSKGAMAGIAGVPVRVIARVVRERDAPTEQCAYRDRHPNYGCPHPVTPSDSYL